MRITLSFIAFIISSHIGYGQRTEFSLQAGSGLFSFFGPKAVSETRLIWGGDYYLENPYGRMSGFSYSMTGQVQHIAKNKYLYGVQIGYEQLTSQVAITGTVGDFGYTPANGEGTLQSQYLNLNPFVGKRFGNAKYSLDVSIGFDAAIGLGSVEFDKLSEGLPFIKNEGSGRPMPDVDICPRLGVTGYYRALGLSLGYSRGLSNYAAKQLGNDATAFSQYWRMGIVYRFGKRS